MKKITLNPKADDSVSEGIPEDMDITEHNPEVETCDEDEDLGSEAPEDTDGSPQDQVNLLSPAVRNKPRLETKKPARCADFAQAQQVLTPTLGLSMFNQGFVRHFLS